MEDACVAIPVQRADVVDGVVVDDAARVALAAVVRELVVATTA